MRRFAMTGRVLVVLVMLVAGWLQGRGQSSLAPLDPIRGTLVLHHPPHSLLREQFIWTQGDAAALNPALQASVRGQDQKIEPHFFRAHFRLAAIPAHATLYLAGPRSADVYLNGVRVLTLTDNGKREKGFNVDVLDVAGFLQKGNNVLAMELVRGHSSLHTGASPTINQVTYGEVLLVKIIPNGPGLAAAPVVASDASWKSTLSPGVEWASPGFDDSGWSRVQTLGAPGSKGDFLQWNADAGLYAWPGYMGVSSAMRTFRIPAKAVLTDSAARIRSPETLIHAGGLQVDPDDERHEPASLTVDFGREINGRVHLVSATDELVQVETSYGESLEEARAHPYLGVRTISVPPHGEAFGPKSGFRFVRLTFPNKPSQWKRIDLEGITYPVRYAGSFESSDVLLNRIWETGAYTAHLCMQEGIWDAPKRDRGRWMGDLDVTGRVISSVFADRRLMEQTLTQVIGDQPVRRDVNTIVGYSALWITGQADFYRHLGDLQYLRTMHGRLLDLLKIMDAALDGDGRFANKSNHKVFVDWSPGFTTDSAEARAATHFEFLKAYREAVYLLNEVHDVANADLYREKARQIGDAAQTYLIDPKDNTFGSRWQTNAMAVVSGGATPAEKSAIWDRVLARVANGSSTDVITPYYGYYVLTAMAALDHRPEAMSWMRRYWGGMLAEGATSFWEAYDPHWPRDDFHASLQADNKKGYYVSLAHGWASGPTAWLMEQVLGIEPTAGGFREVTIRPDLAGLAWARGAEPTPRGNIRVNATPRRIEVTLPPGTTARVVVGFGGGGGLIFVDGRRVAVPVDAAEGRPVVVIRRPGKHVFLWKEASSS